MNDRDPFFSLYSPPRPLEKTHYQLDLESKDRNPVIVPKVGDKVKIKSLEWYEKWMCPISGYVSFYGTECVFSAKMKQYCGKEFIIDRVDDTFYGNHFKLMSLPYTFIPEMFEEVYPSVIKGASLIPDDNGNFIVSPQYGCGIPQKEDLSKRCLELKTNLVADTLEQNIIDLSLSTFFQNNRDTELQTIKRHKFIKLKDL